MDMVNRGRKIVIAMIVVVLLIDIFTTASASSSYTAIGRLDLVSSTHQQGRVRFILTALLLFFLYRGKSWAKWLSVVSFGFGGVSSLMLAKAIFNPIVLGIGLIYTFFCIMLIASSSVNSFLRYQY